MSAPRSRWYVVFPVLLLSVFLGLGSITKGHQWDGDSFSYLMQARALISNDVDAAVALNTFAITESSYAVGPSVYPWGYPVLLAPVLNRFGLHLLLLKSISVVSFVLFLLCLYLLFRRRVSEAGAMIIVALFAMNPLFASFHDLLFSDIPFLFLSTLAVLLIDSCCFQSRSRADSMVMGVAVGAVIFAAFSTRTNGVLLLAVLFAAQAAARHSDGRASSAGAFLPYLAFLILLLVSSTIFPSAGGSHFGHLKDVTVKGLLYNVVYYSALPSAFFESLPLDRPLYVITFPLLLLGVLSSDRRDIPILTYCVLTYMLFVVWPWRSGIRFIFPILPFYVYFLYRGTILGLDRLSGRSRRGASALAVGVTAMTLLVFLVVSSQRAIANLKNDRWLEGPFDAESAAMFRFVSESSRQSDVVVFFRPRIMAFVTGRRSILINDCGQLTRGNFYVFHEQDDRHNQIPLDRLSGCDADMRRVFANAKFRVFEIGEVTRDIPEQGRP